LDRAACYLLRAFTTRKNELVVKELYVADGHRNKGVGKITLNEKRSPRSRECRCGMIKWFVFFGCDWVRPNGMRARYRVYERLGAKIDPDWHEFPACMRKRFRTDGQVITVIRANSRGIRGATVKLSWRNPRLRSGMTTNYRAPANSRFSARPRLVAGHRGNFA